MRIALICLGLGVALATIPLPSSASISLRGMMHDWRRQTRTAGDMLRGRAAFDAGAIRAMLTRFADDAGQIAGAINGKTSDARDIKQRFLAFQADARNAINSGSEPRALQSGFTKVMSNCRSCHDLYKD